MATTDTALRRAVLVVALLNLAYFGIEFTMALRLGSVSLVADSIDFLEDASVNLLIALAMGWSLAMRSRVGMLLAGVLLIPTLATVWAVWSKVADPLPPEPLGLSLTGAGALVVNLACAFILARYRHHRGSLTKAAFLSARNDALANVAIIAAGLLTLAVPSAWPDIVVGVGIAALNIGAAREVWQAARREADTGPAA